MIFPPVSILSPPPLPLSVRLFSLSISRITPIVRDLVRLVRMIKMSIGERKFYEITYLTNIMGP